MTNTIAQQERLEEAMAADSSSFLEMARENWLAVVVNCLMIAVMLALFYFPTRRTFSDVEVNYNEGWNAYRAQMVAQGVRLYATRPGGFATGTAYPPLSFHLASWLGSNDTYVLVGRLISIIAVITTGVLIGLIVRRAGASPLVAVFSFLLYEVAIAILRADRIGMYDPQLLGEALCMAGLYFYVRDPDSRRLLCVSAIFFCLAGFTKHNLLAFPAAVAIDLLFRSGKNFLVWTTAMVVSAGALTALTLYVDGPYFFAQLMGGGGRTHAYWMAWSQFHHYVERYQCILVLGTAWSVRAFRSHKVFVAAFVLSHGLAFMLAGGYGVDMNIFFNSLAATVLVTGLAMSDIGSALVAARPGAANAAAALMFGLFFMSVLIWVPGQLKRDRQQTKLLAVHERDFRAAVSFLKSHAGPALCESHLLCYEAGKPFEYEPFSVRYQVRTGQIREEDVLQLLKTHHFQAVELEVRYDDEDLSDAEFLTVLASEQKDPDKERRFSPNFLRELLQDYRLSLRTSNMAIFVAN